MKIVHQSSVQKIVLFIIGATIVSVVAIGYRYPIPFWFLLIPCVSLIFMGIYSCWWLPLQHGVQREVELREQREETLRMLSQYRHDWLNYIQLVQGYMQMKKYERIADPIRVCVEEAHKHAKIGNLASPFVAYRVMEATLRYPLLQIDVQEPGVVEGEIPFAVESELADILFAICSKGGDLTNQKGEPVKWSFSMFHRGSDGLAIGLHISGDSTSKAYIDQVIQMITEEGLVFERADQVADGYQLIFHLSYSKKGLRLPKGYPRDVAS